MATVVDKQALEELKRSVNTLADRVERGVLTEGDVEQIAQDVMNGSRRVRPPRRGYSPPDMNEPGFAGDSAEAFAPNTILDVGSADREQLARPGRDRTLELQQAYPARVAEALGVPEKVVRQRQVATDLLVMAGAYLGRAAFELDYFASTYSPLVQAMDSTTAGEGDEFVPNLLSGDLIERVNLQLKVVALFPAVNMPSQPFDIPGFAVARQRTGSHAEQTGDTGQTKFKVITPASRKISLDAKKLAVRAITSKELEEDSLIAMLPFMREELIDFLAADLEDAIVNGDTAGTHMDADVVAADDPRKIYDGLRKRTQAGQKTDLSNAAPTVANSLRVNRKKMAKYGVDPAEIAHVMSISSYMQLLGDLNVLTLDKYGAQASILRGELGSVDGSPLVVSEYVRQDLNASGVQDGVTTNRSLILTVNRRGFLTGQRRALTVEVLRELYSESDQDAIVASMRRAFTARFPTTEGVVALTFNVLT